MIERLAFPDGAEATPEEIAEFRQEQVELNEKSQRVVVRYFNLFSFIMLPIYALMSFWTFRKPHNYGEHLVINAYLQGLLFLMTSIVFLISVFTNPGIYPYVAVVSVIYYSYVFKRLYGLSVLQTTGRLIRFLVVLLIICLLTGALLVISGMAAAFIAKAFIA